MNPPEPAHSAPVPSTPSPTSPPSHPSSSSSSPAAASVTTPAAHYTSKQLAFAVPASLGRDEVPNADAQLPGGGSPQFPPDRRIAHGYVQGLNGVRAPSYGGLGSAEGAQNAEKDRLRRSGGGGGGVEERLEKRPRARERRSVDDWREGLQKRQWPYAEGYPYCGNVGNDVLSCFPETNSTLVQGDYSKFIWNSRYPTFIGAGAVDVYLYNADTQDVAASWLNQTNAEGMISILPEDLWWANPTQSTDEWFGDAAQNRTVPYYFVVVDGGTDLTGGEEHQATFDVVQTAAPTSLSSSLAALTSSSLSSVSSASASASSASYLASLSSAGFLSTLSDGSVVTLSPSGTGFATVSGTNGGSSDASGTSRTRGGDLQNNSSGGSSIPKYAIALIVIFGFLALLAGAIAVFFCLGRARKRRRAEEENEAARAREAEDGYGEDDDLTHGSGDPILGGGFGAGGRGSSANASMSQVGSVGALGGLAAAGAGAGAGALGASTGSRDQQQQAADDEGTVSRSDAARMAEAFRAALRQRPEFPAVPSADDSPSDSIPGSAIGLGGAAGAAAASDGGAGPGAGPSPTGAAEGDGSGERNEAGRALVEDELRSEGRSMKSVQGGGGKRWGRQQGSG
ncbi:hypothetical protein JCM6882_002219 [Rhodosporidiobolus microsporus]